MIATIEIKEDLCIFLIKKRSTKLHNSWKKATIDKSDETCLVRQYFVHTLKLGCYNLNAQKYSKNSKLFSKDAYHHGFDV